MPHHKDHSSGGSRPDRLLDGVAGYSLQAQRVGVAGVARDIRRPAHSPNCNTAAALAIVDARERLKRLRRSHSGNGALGMYPWPTGEFDNVMDVALEIAMDYLKRTGQAALFKETESIAVDAIVAAWKRGVRHRIKLADIAIKVVERKAEPSLDYI
jgi:hypothetical protein